MNTFIKTVATLSIALVASTAYASSSLPRRPDPLGGQTSVATPESQPVFTPKESSLNFTFAELSTPEGVEALKNRVRAAARENCYLNSSQENESLEAASAKRKCYNRATKSAMASIDKLVAIAKTQPQ